MTELMALKKTVEMRKEYINLAGQLVKHTTDRVELLDLLGKTKEMIRQLEADLLEIRLISEN
jgi:hypothetical protein